MGPVWRMRATRIVLAAASATLFVLANRVDVLWWLVFVAWVPWLWMLEEAGPRAALGYGASTGVVAIHSTHLWMFKPIVGYVFPAFGIDGGSVFGEAALPWSNLALAGFSVWQGLMWGVAAGVLVVARRASGLSTTWLAPTCVMLVDTGYPNLFPLSVVTPLAEHPWWIQLAELGGVPALTFVVLLINALVYQLTTDLRRRRRPDPRTVGVLASMLVGVPGYGAARVAMVDAAIQAAESVRVGLVQGNFGIATARSHRAAILREHQRVTGRLQREGAEIVVWGETAYGFPGFYLDSTHAPRAGNRRVVRRGATPIIFGARTVAFLGGEEVRPRSSVWVLHPDGSLGDRYDKTHPLPFVESLDQLPNGSGPNPHRIEIGEGPRVLEVDGYRFAPLLGHEDLLPGAARAAADEGVHAFVSLANESWFGATPAQTEHLRLAVLRSVEHRRGLVRVANAGISAHVDPAGRVVESTIVTDSDRGGYGKAAGFVTPVAMMDPASRTPYSRFALGFPLLLLASTVVAVARRRIREPK